MARLYLVSPLLSISWLLTCMAYMRDVCCVFNTELILLINYECLYHQAYLLGNFAIQRSTNCTLFYVTLSRGLFSLKLLLGGHKTAR